MTQSEIKKLASEIIGDGQTPNMWFVTTSPYIRIPNTDFGYHDAMLEDAVESDACTYGPFETYEEAVDCYDEQTLDIEYGIGSVCIEDRMCGTVTEKWLTKKVTVIYEEYMYDDSHRFYKN